MNEKSIQNETFRFPKKPFPIYKIKMNKHSQLKFYTQKNEHPSSELKGIIHCA